MGPDARLWAAAALRVGGTLKDQPAGTNDAGPQHGAARGDEENGLPRRPAQRPPASAAGHAWQCGGALAIVNMLDRVHGHLASSHRLARQGPFSVRQPFRIMNGRRTLRSALCKTPPCRRPSSPVPHTPAIAGELRSKLDDRDSPGVCQFCGDLAEFRRFQRAPITSCGKPVLHRSAAPACGGVENCRFRLTTDRIRRKRPDPASARPTSDQATLSGLAHQDVLAHGLVLEAVFGGTVRRALFHQHRAVLRQAERAE